jgi:hypothetical protein
MTGKAPRMGMPGPVTARSALSPRTCSTTHGNVATLAPLAFSLEMSTVTGPRAGGVSCRPERT